LNIISKRDIKQVRAYIGNAYHESVPYPSNPMVPGNGDPDYYEDLDTAGGVCPFCKKPVQLNAKQDVTKMLNTDGMYDCPHCGGRFSNVNMDRAWSAVAQTPATLDFQGNNTNNEAMGINYHPGASLNQDTFSANLGK
jgi:hypothetical protein